MRTRPTRWLFPFLATLILAGTLTPGCGAQPGTGHTLNMAPLGQMPMEVQQAPVSVQEAYRFAAANPEIMQQMPCYCGCGAMGHTSNYDCYVAAMNGKGEITYDSHALACSICVDITQDVMRLLRQGQAPPAIRNYIDATYSRYGPSNMPTVTP